jgi:sporulation protein YlmC with PRC-barrel domain
MKIGKTATVLAIGLVASALSVQAGETSSSPQSSSTGSKYSQQSSGQSQQMNKDCSISKLLHANAKSKDGQALGSVDDLIINPRTGQIEYAVLDQGGVAGRGEDKVPVPWGAINAQPDGTLIVNKDKAQLKSAPSMRKDYSNLDEPTYTVTVYEFYEVPVSAGASESPGSSGSGSGSSTNSSSQSSASSKP